MNIREQLEVLQDKLEALQREIEEVKEAVDGVMYIKDLFEELNEHREAGDRESAKDVFEQIESLICDIDLSAIKSLDTLIQESLDILQ